jgi:hypothetical protein
VKEIHQWWLASKEFPWSFMQGADILGEGSWAQVVLAWNTVGACAATAQEQWAGSCASAGGGGGHCYLVDKVPTC